MSRRPHHAARATAGVVVLAALWLLGLHVGGLDTGLLFLAPAFVLLLPLLAGRYVGERRLAPLLARLRRSVAIAIHLPRPRLRLLPRGGLLLGCSPAGRAAPAGRPPAAPAARAARRAPRRLPPGGPRPPGVLTARRRGGALHCRTASLTSIEKEQFRHVPYSHARGGHGRRRPRRPCRRAGPRDASAQRGGRRRVHGPRCPRPDRARQRRDRQDRRPVPEWLRRGLLPGRSGLAREGDQEEARHAGPDRRRPDHRRGRPHGLDANEPPWRHQAGPVPGLPDLGADPRQGR